MANFEVVVGEFNDDAECSKLTVVHNGKEVLEAYDGGEPEDRYFFRNFGWVPEAIEKAYALGVEDGRAKT